MFKTSLLFSTHHFLTLKFISCTEYSSLDETPQIIVMIIKNILALCPLFLTQKLLKAPKTLGASKVVRVTKSIFGYVDEIIFEPYLRMAVVV